MGFLMFCNGLIGIYALLELMGYTVGSRCTAASTIFFGVMCFVCAIVAFLYPWVMSDMVGDPTFSKGLCHLCGQFYVTPPDAATTAAAATQEAPTSYTAPDGDFK